MKSLEKKTTVRNSIFRLGLVALAVCLQFIWLVWLMDGLAKRMPILTYGINIASIIMAFWLYGRDKTASLKVPWMVLLLLFPFVGSILYVLTGRSSLLRKIRKHFQEVDRLVYSHCHQEADVLEKVKAIDESLLGQTKLSNFPIYDQTQVQYFSSAAQGIANQIEAMKQAKRFIFMEYHAIEDGQAFAQMKHVLAQKAKEGIEVRLIYDDVGSIGFISPQFIKEMEDLGIACRVFNPVRPLLSVFMNHRDHRKITIVDGQIGYTGGYNLANEYVNLTHPYGYWKDTGLRLEGLAVNSLTLIFLEMWNALKQDDHSFQQYLLAKPQPTDGYVLAFADSPLDNQATGEDMYMNLINRAKKRCWIVTPYLMLTDEMTRALSLCSQRGVDVTIITPGIPDKKIAYAITRSYYRPLAKAGVKIYEYRPGFCHAKMCLVDRQEAIIGTINFDYRSLYLHFENAIYLVGCSCLKEVEADFEQMISQGNFVSARYRRPISWLTRTFRALLRMIAPLF